jgi:opacity protein-like surface antigen
MYPFIQLALAALFIGAASPVLAQTVPAATEGSLPLAIGGGVSSMNPGWIWLQGPHASQGRMVGVTVWADYTLRRVPPKLKGIGLEIEGRDLGFDRPKSDPPNLREMTAGGGVIYTWRHYSYVHPYGKFLMEYGNLNFSFPGNTTYTHDTRTAKVVGGGLECRAYRNIWARADYEYQYWPDLLGHHTLHPQGFTIGAMYHFDHPRPFGRAQSR